MQTTIDKFGRMVIPKALRDELDLRPGSVLDVERASVGIVLKPVLEDQPLIVKEGLLVYSGDRTGEVSGDLDRAVENERDRRHRDVGGMADER